MNIKNLHSKFIGDWQGTYRLILSWLPEPDFISNSGLRVNSVANDAFLLFTYDWHHEGIAQDGILMIGNNNKKGEATASWVDSWGMSGKIMNCFGSVNDRGDITLIGSYEAGDGPDWGWKIHIPCPQSNQLQILMYNISPDGEESLAGDANYNRV